MMQYGSRDADALERLRAELEPSPERLSRLRLQAREQIEAGPRSVSRSSRSTVLAAVVALLVAGVGWWRVAEPKETASSASTVSVEMLGSGTVIATRLPGELWQINDGVSDLEVSDSPPAGGRMLIVVWR